MAARKQTVAVAIAPAGGKVAVWVVALGLVAMVGSALVYFAGHPDLILHQSPQQASAPVGGAGEDAGGMPGMNQEQVNGLMALMQRLEKDPGDLEALSNLAGHFLHLEDYPRAESFALRAVMAAKGADAALPLYMLSMTQHSQGRYKEAADSLEKSLVAQDDAETRYSLGILYRYFLKDEAKGRGELEKALTSPGVTEPLKKQVEQELAKKPE